MPLIRSYRWIGLFVFILLAVLAAGGATVFLYSNTSHKTANEQASKEATTETTTTRAATTSTQPETTARITMAPQKTAPATAAPTGWVTAIGDSVMLGAVDALQQNIPNLGLLDAQGSRQPLAAIDLLRQLRAADYLGDSVVIHIGNNGPFTAEQFDEMMQVLAGADKVLIVNLTVPPNVPDPIAVPNNAVLADGVQRHPNAVLVDWHAASANHPEFFGEDNIHLSLQGAQAYAGLIAANLQNPQEGSGTPPGPLERFSWGEGGLFGQCLGPASWCAAIIP